MGAGASSSSLTDEEKAKYAELEALSPEAQEALAVAAMKDVLMVASKFAVEEGRKEEVWKEDEQIVIPAPMAGFFEHVAQSVAKIPMVGSGLAKPIAGLVNDVQAAFADCAVQICNDPRTLDLFTAAAEGLTSETAKECGTRGGTAYVDFLFEASGDALTGALVDVSTAVLKTHRLTKIWGSAIGACNTASKALKMVCVPILRRIFLLCVASQPPLALPLPLCQEPLELDLPSYAASQALASLGTLIGRKEASVRGGDVEGTTENVVKVFGSGGQKTVAEELIKALVLVKKGDPRALALAPATAAALKGSNTADLGREAAALASAPCVAVSSCSLGEVSGADGSTPNLSLVSKFRAVQKQGKWQHIEVGVGVAAPELLESLESVCRDRVKFAGTTVGAQAPSKGTAEAPQEAQQGGNDAAAAPAPAAAAAATEGASGTGSETGGDGNLLGAPIALVRRDDFLYLCISGEAYPLAVYKWRYFEGNKIVACRHMELNSMTWRTHGGSGWDIDENTGMLSPAKAPEFVLGLRLVDKPKTKS